MNRDLLTLKISVILLGIAVVLMLLFPDHSIENEATEYCRMVWVHHQDPRYGWPDYRHVYAQQCHRDGSVDMGYVYGRQRPATSRAR